MSEDNKKIDFLAIGDIVIDVFIKLKDASIKGTPDNKDYEICLPFADKVPYEDVFALPAVGNAGNVAVAAARLGLETKLVSNVGDDKAGIDCLDSLKKDGVGTELIKINSGIKTNQHFVLWYEAERTILIKHEIYPYSLPEFDEPKWIYFSSVNETAFPFHYTIADYLDAHPETKFAFEPGKFEIKLGKEKLQRLYKHTDMFFCNVEEAKKILGLDSGEIKELLQKIYSLGPKTVIITDGPKGAYTFDGAEYLFMPPYPDPKPPHERTGAGDAFSSTIVIATILGKTLPEALAWAGINSMSVVQEVGAQRGLLTKEKLEEYLENIPESYKTVKI
ncbi:MAG: carbohydrate kinase family protein [Candidatus Pacebacteria bacterium]|nr:carbohydrate kinase family protein [Candidatus Paceibacterota bacterium]